MSNWDDLLAEFRALGGTAENIRLGHGEFGRGLFPVDPARRVVIDIPENLLVPTADMTMVDGAPRVSPEAKVGERERAWLNRYQEDVGWGNGEAGGIRQLFEMAAALPEDVRQELSTEFQCGPWFREPTETLIVRRYFESRHIVLDGQKVVMPLIELINHGDDGENYQRIGTNLRFAGTFSGEMFARYFDGDALGLFEVYGMVIPRPCAFSIALTGEIESTPLVIQRLYAGPARSPRDWIPGIEKESHKITLSFAMTGNERYPRVPKGIFNRLMRDAGYSDVLECFDLVQHVNRLHFLNLQKAVGRIDLPMARMLQDLAHHQLRAMSFCFGVREI